MTLPSLVGDGRRLLVGLTQLGARQPAGIACRVARHLGQDQATEAAELDQAQHGPGLARRIDAVEVGNVARELAGRGDRLGSGPAPSSVRPS